MRGKTVLAAAVLALLAASCGDAGSPATTTTAAVPSAATTAPTTTAGITTTTPTVAVATTSTSLAPVTAAAALDPPLDNWIVILASLPVEEFTRADADARLAELAPPAGGLLLSSDYPSLNPGYWVVYSGVFDEDAAARDHCATLSVDCYHRYLGASADTAPTLANGRALVWILGEFNLDLAVVSLDTGEVVRTVAEGRGEGEFPGPPRIGPSGGAAFLDIGFEDSWFSCEATLGDVFRVDLETGRLDPFVKGFGPAISPDGRYLAWIEAPACLEDPAEPIFFIAFHETIVVRDLETGRERRWRPSDGIAGSEASIVYSLGWAADSERLYFRLPDGLRELNLATPTSTPTDDLQVIPLFGYGSDTLVFPLGQLKSGELVLEWQEGEPDFDSGIDLYDLVAGERTALAEGFVRGAVDTTASSFMWAEGDRLRSVGAVEVDVGVPGEIFGLGW